MLKLLIQLFYQKLLLEISKRKKKLTWNFQSFSCTISSSLIGNGSKIKEKTSLSNVVIGPCEEIISGDYKNETICLQQNKFYWKI